LCEFLDVKSLLSPIDLTVAFLFKPEKNAISPKYSSTASSLIYFWVGFCIMTKLNLVMKFIFVPLSVSSNIWSSMLYVAFKKRKVTSERRRKSKMLNILVFFSIRPFRDGR